MNDSELLTGKRFFGRIRSFDLACPRCDQVYQVGQGTRTGLAWEPRTSRFRCVSGCALRMSLGILGWNVALGQATTPADSVPLNPYQATQLRDLSRATFLGKKLEHKGNQNRVLIEECSCFEIKFDPGCKLHGKLR